MSHMFSIALICNELQCTTQYAFCIICSMHFTKYKYMCQSEIMENQYAMSQCTTQSKHI